ncbi:MAG: ROK family protein [Clostridiales bacterium]|nr:ROK family protein [Clostridiales bacterium]
MNLLAVDIGGTSAKIGVIHFQGEIRAQKEVPVSFDAYQTPIADTVLYSARQFLEKEQLNVAGIGISATGQIDMEKGLVAGTCGNLPGWVHTPLKDLFEKNFHLPTVVLNDANSALVGEQWLGAAKEEENVIMVTLGTGVGGGIITGGHLVGGAKGFAGEIGHIPLYHQGKQCTCGNLGCYEQYASVTALIRQSKSLLEKMNMPVTGRSLFTLAQQKQIQAQNILSQWIADIGAGLVGLTHLFNPALILIGGGVSVQKDLLISPLREKVFQNLMPNYQKNLRLEAATLGNNAGMLGAAKHWLDTR